MNEIEPIDLDDPKFAGGYVLGEDPETGEITATPAGQIDPATELTQTEEAPDVTEDKKPAQAGE